MTALEHWNDRAVLCEFLSIAFSCPDAALAQALASGEFASAAYEIAELAQVSIVAADREAIDGYAGRESASVLREVRAEYTRLFVGAPRALVSPYEGVWRSRADGIEAPLLMVNRYAEETRDFLASVGVAASDGRNIPLDHIALELEFLGYAASVAAGIMRPVSAFDDAQGAYGRFVRDHLDPWSSAFCAGICAQTRLAFYRVSAQILAGAFPASSPADAASS